MAGSILIEPPDVGVMTRLNAKRPNSWVEVKGYGVLYRSFSLQLQARPGRVQP
jgi:hypothetical protein